MRRIIVPDDKIYHKIPKGLFDTPLNQRFSQVNKNSVKDLISFFYLEDERIFRDYFKYGRMSEELYSDIISLCLPLSIVITQNGHDFFERWKDSVRDKMPISFKLIMDKIVKSCKNKHDILFDDDYDFFEINEDEADAVKKIAEYIISSEGTVWAGIVVFQDEKMEDYVIYNLFYDNSLPKEEKANIKRHIYSKIHDMILGRVGIVFIGKFNEDDNEILVEVEGYIEGQNAPEPISSNELREITFGIIPDIANKKNKKKETKYITGKLF